MCVQNEVYITPSWDVNPLTAINGKATIVSRPTFDARYPSGKVPRTAKDHGKIFVCRRGCNTRTATYTDEFIWEDIYGGAEDLDALIARVQSQTKATRKRKRDNSYEDAGINVWTPRSSSDFLMLFFLCPLSQWYGKLIPAQDTLEDRTVLKTPTKRRKFAQASTPTSKSTAKHTPQKYTTPTHKR